MFSNILHLSVLLALASIPLIYAEGYLFPAIPKTPGEAGDILEKRAYCPSGYDSCDGTSNWCCPIGSDCYVDSYGFECCCSDPLGCSGTCPPPSYFSTPASITPSPTPAPSAVYSGFGATTVYPVSFSMCISGYGSCDGTSHWCCPFGDSCYVDSSGDPCCCSDPDGCTGNCPPPLSYYPSFSGSSVLGTTYTPVSTATAAGGTFTLGGQSSPATQSSSAGDISGSGGQRSTRTKTRTLAPLQSNGPSASNSAPVQSNVGGAGSRVETDGGLLGLVFVGLLVVPGGLMVLL